MLLKHSARVLTAAVALVATVVAHAQSYVVYGPPQTYNDPVARAAFPQSWGQYGYNQRHNPVFDIPADAPPFLTNGVLTGSPLTGDEYLRVGKAQQYFPDDGNMAWGTTAAQWIGNVLGFSLAQGIVYAQLSSREIYAVDAETGFAIWRQQLDGVAGTGPDPGAGDRRPADGVRAGRRRRLQRTERRGGSRRQGQRPRRRVLGGLRLRRRHRRAPVALRHQGRCPSGADLPRRPAVHRQRRRSPVHRQRPRRQPGVGVHQPGRGPGRPGQSELVPDQRRPRADPVRHHPPAQHPGRGRHQPLRPEARLELRPAGRRLQLAG
ncbi:MAG: hypothetical protein MZU95_10460 [Desulfomicrobium escambiense]|nr:hypothetical protein [Desulfomicrobium escambiense]